VQHLEKVEDADAKLVQQDRIGEPQCRESEEQQESKSSGQTKSLRQSCKPRH
jgi:hypothetical protein